MKKKVIVGLVLLSVLAFGGVVYEQPCLAGIGCVDAGSSYNDWMAPYYSTASEPECIMVSDMGDMISVVSTDMDCYGSHAAHFDVEYNDGAPDDIVLGVGDSRQYGDNDGWMELYVSDIFCGDNNYHVVEIELGYESPPPPPPCSGIYGDVNGNGYINSVDALMALQHASGSLTLTDCQLERADVTAPYGVVNIADANCILQHCGRTGQSLP